MLRKKDRPTPEKPARTPPRPRRNAWEPQVSVPQKVDLPLPPEQQEEVTVPAGVNGRSLADGRL